MTSFYSYQVKKNWPNRWKRTRKILLGAHSYVTMRLTKARCSTCDPTTACTTGLQDATNPLHWHDLNDQVLEGVRQLLPPIYPADKSIGIVDSKFSRKFQIFPRDEETAVFVGSGDLGSVTIGAGSGIPGKYVYGYIGTSGWVAHTTTSKLKKGKTMTTTAATKDKVTTPATVTTLQERIALTSSGEVKKHQQSLHHQPPEQQLPGVFLLSHPCDTSLVIKAASCITACGNIEWIRKAVGAFDCEKEAGKKVSYEDFDKACMRSAAGCNGVLYLPWLNGERSPFTNPTARACFIGINSDTSKADMYRAVVEGICYSYKSLVTVLNLMDDIKDGFMVVGGATKSRVFMQILSDILRVKVIAIPNSRSVGTVGAVIMAGKSLGWYSSLRPNRLFSQEHFKNTDKTTVVDDSAACVCYEPSSKAKDSRIHAERYKIYSGLSEILKGTFSRLLEVSFPVA
mmetsp:Transcript_34695/g.55817  ORF Transcript_34695/g.55817 Transcript_34695/m.55817 type:complete len:456 (-) Transcript_34695:188-1555(-)